MKDSIRLFVAATIPPELKEQLAQQLQHYKDPNLRFLPSDNLHLTLYFIGNIALSELSVVKQMIRDTALSYSPFTLTFNQTEPAPNPKKPRLIWAKFEPDQTFEQLSIDLTQKLSKEQSQPKKSIPHITLARFRKDKPAPKHLPITKSSSQLNLPVHSISLWQSELASPHPVYTVLETYKLG